MRIIKISLAIIALLAAAYLLGPRPAIRELNLALPEMDIAIEELDAYIAAREAGIRDLKPDNEARIVWAGPSQARTPFSIVYLHGFSASPMEGDPVHREIARRFGANLYMARLYGHGIESENSFADLTPQKLMDSALDALAMGKMLGDSVILMSCSTGGTLSLILAAHHPVVHSLILYSPNIDFARPDADMLTKPWGLHLARLMMGGKYRSLEEWPQMAPYWTMRYRLEGLVNLKLMVEKTMNKKTFSAVSQPVFMGYYFKDETLQDEVVSVEAMKRMFGQLGTPPELKRQMAFPESGSHVLNSSVFSGDLEGVIEGTSRFCENVLNMPQAIVMTE